MSSDITIGKSRLISFKIEFKNEEYVIIKSQNSRSKIKPKDYSIIYKIKNLNIDNLFNGAVLHLYAIFIPTINTIIDNFKISYRVKRIVRVNVDLPTTYRPNLAIPEKLKSGTIGYLITKEAAGILVVNGSMQEIELIRSISTPYKDSFFISKDKEIDFFKLSSVIITKYPQLNNPQYLSSYIIP